MKTTNKNTASKSKAKAAIDPMLQRMKVIEKLGRKIEDVKGQIGKQESVVARSKSDLDDEKESLQGLNQLLSDYQEELDGAACGRFSENLFIAEPPAVSAAAAAAVASTPPATNKPTNDPEGWKSATLKEIGITKAGIIARLFDEGINNFGQLEEWLASGKKIPGMGEAARQHIDDAKEKFLEKHKAFKPSETTEKSMALKSGIEKPATQSLMPKVHEPADLKLKPGAIAAACHAHLVNASSNGKACALREVINFNGIKYVVVPGRTLRGAEYELLPLQPPTDIKPAGKGGYTGRRVMLDGTELMVGAVDGFLLANDGDAAGNR